MIKHSDSMEAISTALAAASNCGRVWSPAPGATRYLISDSGEVLSLLKRKPRKMRPIAMGKYQGVQITDDCGQRVHRYLHRLVLEAFVGTAPGGMEARHLDGNRFNNTVSNLAWGTRKENHADKRRHGTTAKGERNPQAKLTPEAVEQMRSMYASGGWTYKRLAAHFGVSTMTALRAVKGESWS